MRNFLDSWQNLFDNTGNYLHGRVTFYEVNTLEKKAIYATDGQTLPNPIYTTTYGMTTNQVFLDDKDYTIIFEKYIGNGEMETDFDNNNWVLFKTIISKNGQLSIEDNTNSIRVVRNISELKAITGMTNNDMVLVLGYYEIGDCPPRYFQYKENSTFADDGGGIIYPTNITDSAWYLNLPHDYVDVRWFGDMPNNSASVTTCRLGQRALAANYANRMSKDLYFPSYGRNTPGFYVFDGSNTVTISRNIKCDDVYFIVKENTTETYITCKQLEKDTGGLFRAHTSQTIGGYRLLCDWVNTSWFDDNKDSYTYGTDARIGVNIDYTPPLQSPIVPITITGLEVKVLYDTIGIWVFDNCLITECKKRFNSTTTYKNMKFDCAWVTDIMNESTSGVYVENAKVVLENCINAQQYIRLKNQMNDVILGDCGGQTVENQRLLPNTQVMNLNGSVTFGNTTIEGTFVFDNCNLTTTGISTNTSQSIALRNSTLLVQDSDGEYQDATINILHCKNSTIGGKFTCDGSAEFYNTTVNGYYNSWTVTANNCYINGEIRQGRVSAATAPNTIYCNITNNSFGANGLHYIYGNANRNNSLVAGVWLNNNSIRTDDWAVKVFRLGVDEDDTKHTYTFKGNTGPGFAIETVTRNIRIQADNADTDSDAKISFDSINTSGYLYVLWGNVPTGEWYTVWRPRIFTIGRLNIAERLVEVTYKGTFVVDGEYEEEPGRWYGHYHNPFLKEPGYITINAMNTKPDYTEDYSFNWLCKNEALSGGGFQGVNALNYSPWPIVVIGTSPQDTTNSKGSNMGYYSREVLNWDGVETLYRDFELKVVE